MSLGLPSEQPSFIKGEIISINLTIPKEFIIGMRYKDGAETYNLDIKSEQTYLQFKKKLLDNILSRVPHSFHIKDEKKKIQKKINIFYFFNTRSSKKSFIPTILEDKRYIKIVITLIGFGGQQIKFELKCNNDYADYDYLSEELELGDIVKTGNTLETITQETLIQLKKKISKKKFTNLDYLKSTTDKQNRSEGLNMTMFESQEALSLAKRANEGGKYEVFDGFGS